MYGDSSIGSIFLLGFTVCLVITDSAALNRTLPNDTGFYCYVRCLAKCVGELQTTTFSNDSCSTVCQRYNSQQLCAPNNAQCWTTCNDLINKTENLPQTPRSLVVDYVTVPEPNPRLAIASWNKNADAQLYIVQYADSSDDSIDWSDLSINSNITTKEQLVFDKTDLCSEYGVRVAAVNAFGISEFTELQTLSVPKPVVINGSYELISAELLNETLPAIVSGEQSIPNTVRIVVGFEPPPNWDMTTDIERVEFLLHVIQMKRMDSLNADIFSPFLKQIPGKPQCEILLPGGIAFSEEQFQAMFLVTKMYTKCKTQSDPYPNIVNDRGDQIPGLLISLNCQSIKDGRCPPPRVVQPWCKMVNVTSEHSCINDTAVNVTVRFTMETQYNGSDILYYLVRYGEASIRDPTSAFQRMIGMIENGDSIRKLPNDSNEFTLTDIPLHRQISAQICAIYNESTKPDWKVTGPYDVGLRNTDCRTPTQSSNNQIAMFIPIAVAVVTAIILVLLMYFKFRRDQARQSLKDMLKTKREDSDGNAYVEQPRRHDRWELPRAQLLLYQDQKLGSGAFGAVYKGKLLGKAVMDKNTSSILAENWMNAENSEVAVKMLPEYADEMAKSDFRKEINLMKQFGYHERLVNMLCCITADEPLCLIVEYCSDGDLLHYLRNRCKYMIKLQEQGVNLDNLSDDHDVDLSYILSLKDLLSFAWQISVGLEYLSEKGYIHRDVAARNILVDAGKRAKIGDFGLCRYSYSDPIYMSKGGRLPWKWMALEAICNYEFTTKSDVWSYGVLLFEIITLGGSPYPEVEPSDMLNYLKSGNRLKKPETCPDDFYSVMWDCWLERADLRPSFSVVRERLRNQLEEMTEDYSYLKLNQTRDYYNGARLYNGYRSDTTHLALFPIRSDDVEETPNDDDNDRQANIDNSPSIEIEQKA